MFYLFLQSTVIQMCPTFVEEQANMQGFIFLGWKMRITISNIKEIFKIVIVQITLFDSTNVVFCLVLVFWNFWGGDIFDVCICVCV